MHGGRQSGQASAAAEGATQLTGGLDESSGCRVSSRCSICVAVLGPGGGCASVFRGADPPI